MKARETSQQRNIPFKFERGSLALVFQQRFHNEANKYYAKAVTEMIRFWLSVEQKHYHTTKALVVKKIRETEL